MRVDEPDGNTRHLGYDGEGNVLHIQDDQRDVHLDYQGLGRLAARTEAGTTLRFEYDTEEQLTGIVNAARPRLPLRARPDAARSRSSTASMACGAPTPRPRRPGRPRSRARAARSRRYRYDRAGRVVAIARRRHDRSPTPTAPTAR